MLRKKDIDATQGPILKNFIVFAIPLAIGGIIQALFNAADMMVLANLGSGVAVAAVGATSTIIAFLVNSFIGLSSGAQVVLAHAYGEHNKQKIQKTVNTSLILATVMGLALVVIGLTCADWFLHLTKMPRGLL